MIAPRGTAGLQPPSVRNGHGVHASEHILDEFPMTSTYDVAVIGAGPNGLMAAAYLARAGLNTVVVERRQEIGGGLSTEECLFPGYYTNPHAFYHMMVDYMPVLRDFDLTGHGLYFVKPNAQCGALFSDGSSLLLCNQIEDTKDSIAKFSQADALGFGRIMRTWRKLVAEVVAPGTYVPALSPLDMIERFEATSMGREVLRLSEMSPVEIVEEVFGDDRVRALMLYVACMWGLDPHESGLGFMVPLMIDRAMNKAQCYGGSHKLAGSLSREILRAGGTVIDNAEVVRILVEGGRARGVELFDGRVIEARAVLSSLPPPLTFGRLMDAGEVPGEMAEVAESWDWDKWSFFTVSAVTEVAPHYECDDPWVDDALMVVMGFDSTNDVLAHFAAAINGELPERVGGHATVETRYDPTLARVPGHQVSFFQTHAPYAPEGGWDSQAPELANRLCGLWARHCPSLATQGIVMRSIETPVDIERRVSSMVRGSIKHGDYHPLQMGVFRPHDSCTAGRSPVGGLYLCGASSYPGGLVIGGPGYIAAASVVEDLDGDRWWELPAYVKRYAEQYAT